MVPGASQHNEKAGARVTAHDSGSITSRRSRDWARLGDCAVCGHLRQWIDPLAAIPPWRSVQRAGKRPACLGAGYGETYIGYSGQESIPIASCVLGHRKTTQGMKTKRLRAGFRRDNEALRHLQLCRNCPHNGKSSNIRRSKCPRNEIEVLLTGKLDEFRLRMATNISYAT